MIFQCGFVHCDPHPGNILVRCPGARDGEGTGDGVQIVLLDHGLYTVSCTLESHALSHNIAGLIGIE